MKNLVDTRFFTPEVCVEAPQTSAGSHRRNHLRDFASGVSAQERFDMEERVMMKTEMMLSLLNTAYRLSALAAAASALCAVLLFFRLKIPDVLAWRRNGYEGRGQRRVWSRIKTGMLSAGYAGSQPVKEKTRRELNTIPYEIPANPGTGEKGDTIRLDVLSAEEYTSLNRKAAGGQKKQSGCEADSEIFFEITVNNAIIHTEETV